MSVTTTTSAVVPSAFQALAASAAGAVDAQAIVNHDDALSGMLAGNANGGKGRAKPVQSGKVRLQWKDRDGNQAAKGAPFQTATVKADNGSSRTYTIVGSGAASKLADHVFTLTVTPVKGAPKVTELLANVSHGKAYDGASNTHHYDQLTKPVAAK